MAVGAGADSAGAATGLFQPRVAVAFGQPQDAQAGAVALLGVRPVGEDGFDERGGVRADGAAPGDEARGAPLQVLLMGLGHVGGIGGVAAAEGTAWMGGHALAAVEDFDGGGGQARVDPLMQEAIGDGVVWSSSATW